ncbi:hypothetical protein SAMN05216364_101333 [Porphyromonadaceae bacterium KHP3R9]|nr:hypothetical protein SAMN05216364_101333 [Porphyromonadaceae bacterium KHP3R9]
MKKPRCKFIKIKQKHPNIFNKKSIKNICLQFVNNSDQIAGNPIPVIFR